MELLTKEEEGILSITFDEQHRTGDEVENLVAVLGDASIEVIGEAYTQMDGTCPAMLYSCYSDRVYIIDLVGDCEKLMQGQTVRLSGRCPTDDEREVIEDEIA